MNNEKINLKVTDEELAYLIACGAALLQNIPENSLPTYCQFDKKQIIEFTMKLARIAEIHNLSGT